MFQQADLKARKCHHFFGFHPPLPTIKKTPKGVFFVTGAILTTEVALPSIASIRFLRLHLFFHEKRDI